MASNSVHRVTKQSFLSRAEANPHPLSTYLFQLMELKKSNLCLSADVSTANTLLSLADTCGPSIVVLKTHYDLISNWDYHPLSGTGAKLGALARKHGFLIFEDRKFGDIGHTVQLQYCEGTARIIEWSHITNVNMVPGKAVVGGMHEAAKKWAERRRFHVRTNISVGTPRAESVNGDLEAEGEDNGSGNADANHDSELSEADTDVSTSSANTSTSYDTGASVGYGAGSGNTLHSYNNDTSGRKASIVSITTVSQHFEPADSKEKDFVIHGQDVFPGIDEPPLERGLLILAQMSSEGNFMTGDYTQACIEAAREYPDYVMGFISQESLNSAPTDQFLSMTPGCQLPPPGEESTQVKGDGLGQQYNTPEKIVGLAGNDIVIVGRGIIKAHDPAREAMRYREQAWTAYEKRTGQQ
ncbi:orotidine-5 -phosphate decarboxylase [Phlyctema vagabunda]|uniref:Orotidine 5'-phosphate decarboxylase n=1 Tax=Phlyctema vagabunda TaxID=108571 RepID=A0ABR4PP21_9HELO